MQDTSNRQDKRIAMRRLREQSNVFARMPATYTASRKQGQRILQAAGGLSVVEWRVLWDLSEAGPMSIREMAEIQRIDHSQLSRALPNMRDKNLVVMRQSSDDGRQVVVDITPLGAKAYARAAPVMKRRRDALQSKFTEAELAQFISMLDRLEDFLREPIDKIVGVETVE